MGGSFGCLQPALWPLTPAVCLRRGQHHRTDPGLQQYHPQPAAQLHAAHRGGERPHGLRLPRHDHCKSKEEAPVSSLVSANQGRVSRRGKPVESAVAGSTGVYDAWLTYRRTRGRETRCVDFNQSSVAPSSWCCAAPPTAPPKRSTSAVSAGETSSSCRSNTSETTV